MEDRFNEIATDFAESILAENMISKEVVKTKFKAALNILVQDSPKYASLEITRHKRKLQQRKIQARLDAVEKTFWKEIAKIYIGENNMKPYFDRLKLELEKANTKQLTE